MRVRWIHFAVSLGVLGLQGCAVDLPLITDTAARQLPQEYLIGVGDQLAIKFYYSPELNELAIVRPDGRVSLQLVGEVKVAGRTAEAVSLELEERYGQHLSEPDVAIVVQDFASMRAYVGGEVQSPRMVRLDGQTSLTQALFESGGILDGGARSSVILLRHGAEGTEAYRVDVDRCLAGEAETPVLRAYDVVFVPKSFIAKVGMYVDLYINKLVPRNASFSAIYQIDQSGVPLF